MTENAKIVLQHLKDNYGTPMTKQDIAAALGVVVAAVVGTCNGLKKKGFLEEEVRPMDVDGKTVEYKFVSLNQAGFDYDPDAVEAAEKERKAAEKAAKAAAKAAGV